jgi:hypothetical protein
VDLWITVGNHYEVIDSSDSNRLGLVNDKLSIMILLYTPCIMSADDTGKVISLAEVSDYNIIYVGGLSPNLTYGKSYSTLKLNNSMHKYFIYQMW